MSSVDAAALGGGLAVFATFYLVRDRFLVYLALTAAGIACATAVGWSWDPSAPAAAQGLLPVGLALCAFGLLIVRVMLKRSVSLHLLAGLLAGRPDWSVEEEISGRLEEATRLRLVCRTGDRYSLTWLGRLTAAIVGALYGLTGAER